MQLKKAYKNYIFDLYGTLIDIHTDESDPRLWEFLAGLYRCRGAVYSGQEIRQRYHELVRQLEAEISAERGYKYPEIRLEDVFIRLLEEKSPDPSDAFDIDTWVFDVASTFRVLSRKYLAAYDGTLSVLSGLKDRGCSVHLLSNAQRVFTMPELEMTGVLPYLDSVFISSDLGMKKPQPEFMEAILEQNGLKAEDCVMVGNDFSTDIRTAADFGMDAVFINSFHYDEEKIRSENIFGAEVINDISELI